MNEIASKYAFALYELALENNQLDIYQEQIRFVLNSLDENKEFFDVLNSKFISVKEIHDIIEKTFVGIEIDIISLLKIIVENHRVEILRDVLVSYNSMCNSYKGITEGISAFHFSKT